MVAPSIFASRKVVAVVDKLSSLTVQLDMFYRARDAIPELSRFDPESPVRLRIASPKRRSITPPGRLLYVEIDEWLRTKLLKCG